jgi:hypothetical protein
VETDSYYRCNISRLRRHFVFVFLSRDYGRKAFERKKMRSAYLRHVQRKRNV